MAWFDDLGSLASQIFNDDTVGAAASAVDDLGPASGAGSILGIGGGGSDWLGSLISALGGPQAFSTLLGTLGPVAGLAGNLASGGQGPTQTGQTSQNVSQNQTGFNNQTGFQNNLGASNQQGTSSLSGTQSGATTQGQTSGTTQSGFQNTTSTPTLDPRSSAAADRLTAMLTGGPLGSQVGDAYSKGLQGLLDISEDGFTGGINAQRPGAPNTSPSAAAVTGFPDKMPTDINPELVGLIKQAFGTMTGDIASQAITGARNRGFAGGADLLGSAAAPIAGQALAAVPAKEAEAYLAHVLQAYDLQSQNAARKAGAEQGSLNAATNALMPGVNAYGHDVSAYLGELNAGNSRMNSQIGLMQALMGPQSQAVAANLGLMNALPHGTTANTLTGGSGASNLSGFGTSNTGFNQSGANTLSGNTASQSQSGQQSQSGSQSQSQSQGNTSGTTTNPLGNVFGTGLGNIIGGAGVGYAAGSTGGGISKQTLMKLLLGG